MNKCAYCGSYTYGDNLHCEDCLMADAYDEDDLDDEYFEDKCTRCHTEESPGRRVCPWSQREGSDDLTYCDCCDSCAQICKPTPQGN